MNKEVYPSEKPILQIILIFKFSPTQVIEAVFGLFESLINLGKI